jgi:cytochrome c2
MRIRAHVVSDAAYNAWLDNQAKQAVVPPAGSAAERGLKLVTDQKSKCVACHTIYGNKTMLGVLGPNLTHVAAEGRGLLMADVPASRYRRFGNVEPEYGSLEPPLKVGERPVPKIRNP